jgi:K(+)-stimulated pyrophosphate-energized sodium pump
MPQPSVKGMVNIFLGVFVTTLAFACLDPYFFIGYLIAIAISGLFQAIFMAHAGGAWDNAKKLVEVDLQEKNTPCTRRSWSATPSRTPPR